MKIGVIGAGRIGKSVGAAWINAGHDVIFGVRNPDSASELPAQVGTIADAISHADAIFFAIPGRVMLETVADLPLDGKLIIDATNGGDTPEKTMIQALADLFPNASVYKAFNTLGFENFQNPNFGDKRADLLFVGSEDKQDTMAQLIDDAGLNPLYVGGLDKMNILDAGMRFWFALSGQFGRHVAFNVLTD